MIQPDKLRRFNVAEIPPAVFQAWEAHRAFVTASSHAAESIGVRFLDKVGPVIIALDFFRSMLEHGGTTSDIQWLLDELIIEESDEILWSTAVADYATRGMS